MRRAAGAAPGAADLPVGSAGADAESIQTFPWVRHEADTTYIYRLTAIGGGGVENLDEVVISAAAFTASGQWAGAQPNAPADLRVRPTAGGRFLLRWTYVREGEQAEPASFRVYHDGGTGTVDFGTVVAAVPYRRGRLHYEYTSGAFDHDTRVRWAVRAVSEPGVEDGNEHVVQGRSEALPPPINPVVCITVV